MNSARCSSVSWLNRRAALDALGVVAHEPVDARTQEAHALAAVEHQPPADKAQGSPPRNGLGRDVELLGQLFDREHLLAHGVGGQLGGVGQIFHQQAQVMHQIFAGNLAVGGARSSPSRCSSTWSCGSAGRRRRWRSAAQRRRCAPAAVRGSVLVLVIAQLSYPRISVVNMHGPPLLSTSLHPASTWCSLRLIRPRQQWLGLKTSPVN